MSNKAVVVRRALMSLFSNESTAWVILVVSLVITVLASYFTGENIRYRAADRFAYEVDEARQHIAKRMHDYEQVLRGGVALFETMDGKVSREDWRRYVTALQFQTQFPGIQGVGFAVALAPHELQPHIDAVRAEGFPAYTVTPRGSRGEYTAVVYLEPFDARNQRAFGFDMFSQPKRHAAMAQARDTGRTAVSGRVTLLQETDQDVQPGFLMYLPVYRPGLPVDTVAERRKALLGYVYAPFRVNDLMQGILATERPDVDFQLYEGTSKDALGELLYSSETWARNRTGRALAQHRTITTIDIPGHTWAARFHSTPSFDAAMSSSQPLVIAVGGFVVDLLLFLVIRSLASERRRVQAKAEEMTAELRESTQRLQLAQDSVGAGIWDLNLDGRTLVWDARMFELFDIPPEAFDGTEKEWWNRIHPDDRTHLEESLQECIRNNTRLSTTFRAHRRDGSWRTFEAQAILLRDDCGRATHVIGINRDVTERAAAEQALASQHALLQSIIDGIPEKVVLKDRSLIYRAANAAVAAFVDKPVAEIIGRTDYDIFSREDAERNRRSDREVLETGRPVVRELTVTSANGPIWEQVVKVPQRSQDGTIEGVLTSVRDISSLKRSEQSLRRSHAELEATFATTHARIAVLDCGFRFLRVNAAYAAFAGRSGDALIGMRLFDLFPSPDYERIFRDVAATGEPFSGCAMPFDAPDGIDGPTLYWDWSLSPLKGEHGGVDGLVLTLIDATEREQRRQEAENAWREANEDLDRRVRERTREWAEANNKLESANRELETFSYSVSHDLRGPLRAINGFTQILAEDYEGVLDTNGRDYIARVRSATLRMGELIDGLLDLSRVLRGDIQTTSVDLSALADDVARTLSTGGSHRKAQFRIEPGLHALGDQTLIRVLLQNLLGNAWKFTARRDIAEIEFGCSRLDGREVFYVRDNGVGFDMAYAAQLFRPFHRLHGHHEFEGTGIGLATVRRIIQRHGGEVWAEGAPDRGATIFFTLSAGTACQQAV